MAKTTNTAVMISEKCKKQTGDWTCQTYLQQIIIIFLSLGDLPLNFTRTYMAPHDKSDY